MNPFQGLLQSRKFWLLVLDTVVSMTIYFGGKYLQAGSEDIVFMVAALQPVFAIAINAITREDVAQLEAGTHPTQAGKLKG